MKQTVAVILLMCIIAPVALYTFDASTAGMLWGFSPKEVAYASGSSVSTVGNHFLQHYFSNLNTNLSCNEASTCGYVAVGMLLSYFDTYWDDDIVPEEYEVTASIDALNDYVYNSPGAGGLRHSNSGCSYVYDPNNPNDFILHMANAHSQDILQAALFDCRIDILESYGSIDLRSIAADVAEDVANEFLSQYSSSNTIYTSSHYTELFGVTNTNTLQSTSTTVRNRIIENVKKNIPVAVYYGSTTDWNQRHVAIAYDYDEANDMLYLHLGYQGRDAHCSEVALGIFRNSSSTNVTKYYYGDLTFFLQYSHNHSNNFVLGTGGSVCSCQLGDHEHSYSYANYSASYHRTSCYCGYSALESHSYKLSGTKYVCRYCQRIYTGSGTPIIPVLPVNYENEGETNEWIGSDVADMEVPIYEE